MPSELNFLSGLALPAEVYELVAQAARYWFLFLMAIIVWRSYRWYRRDRRQAKKRLRLLPDAGYVGEMVVLEGGGALRRGQALPLPREGTLGTLRTNDLCVPVEGVAKRHLWFRFDQDEGLMIQPMRGRAASVDGEPCKKGREAAYMAHGSRLVVGKAELRLRLFAGFESTSRVVRRDGAQAPEEPQTPAQDPQAAALAQQQAMQQWMAQQQYLMQQQLWQQQAYQQWLMEQQAAAQEDEAQEPPVRDDSIFMRPAGESAPAAAEEPEPAQAPESPDVPEPDGEDWPYAPSPYGEAEWEAAYDGEMDEDLTDAAAPPKSAYVGHDEAERATRKVWDKYFGGGRGR